MQHQPTLESFDSIVKQFKSCFSKPSFLNFTTLVVGWILCRRRRWITRVFVASGALSERHVSAFYRFFTSARWDPDQLSKRLLDLLLRHLPRTVEAMVDDTLCRRSGPRIFGISMHHDGAASSYGTGASGKYSNLACGHAWVILSVRVPVPWNDRGLAVPVLFRLYRSPKRCSKAEYKKRTELAREMVETLGEWLPGDRALHVTGDREYACKTLLRGLNQDIHFTGPMPMNARLFEPIEEYKGLGRPRVKGASIPNPADRIANRKEKWLKTEVCFYERKTKLLVKSWTCLWYTATGQRLVRVVLARDPKGNFQDRAYFSTNTDLTPGQVLKRYASRWLIEVSFRDGKQLFGLSDPQNGFSRGKRTKGRPKPGPQPRGNRGRRAVERTVPFIWIVYGITIAWYLGEARWVQDAYAHRARAPWYTTKASPSFEDMVDALRMHILSRRLLNRPLKTGTLEETQNTLIAVGIAA